MCPRLGGRGWREGSGSCSFVSQPPRGEARAQPVQAKNRKQVDFAEARTGGWDVRRPTSGQQEVYGGGGKKRAHF